MNSITREDLERFVERIRKAEKKRIFCVAGIIAVVAVIVTAAVLIYKKLTPDPDDFEDDLDDDDFFEDFEDDLEEEESEDEDEDIFEDESAEAQKAE
jgi:hypothetical protein